MCRTGSEIPKVVSPTILERGASNSTAGQQMGSRPGLAPSAKPKAALIILGKTCLAEDTDGGEFMDLLNDAVLCRGLNLRIHGKREDLQSSFFSDREVTFFETERFVGFL